MLSANVIVEIYTCYIMTAIVGSNLHVIKVYTAILQVIIAVIIILVITVVAFTCNRKTVVTTCDCNAWFYYML